MKKTLISILTSVFVFMSGMSIQADTTTKIFKDLKVNPSQGSIKVGDEFTYSVEGFEFDTALTPDLVGQQKGALMFEFFSESMDSSIELQSIEFPKTQFVTDEGETYGTLFTVMNFEQSDGFDVTTWLSDPQYKVTTRDQYVNASSNFTKNGFRVYVRPTHEGSDYGIYDKTYKSMKSEGPIKFNYKVVGDGHSANNKPNPYFVFMASSPETGFPKENAFGYTYFADYSINREIVEPYNSSDRSLSIKYTITNTGAYPVTRINLYENSEGFIPQGGDWNSDSAPIYLKQVKKENAYELINPGEHVEFVEKFILDENYNQPSYTFTGGLYTNNDFARRTPADDLTVNFEVQKYKVNFVVNGGSEVVPYLNISKDSLINVPSSVKEGFKLMGWYKDELLSERWNFTTDRVTCDTTLYAKWEKLPVAEKYDVTFNSNGGTIVENQLQLTAGSKVSKPLNPSREGFTFKGWYQDSALTSEWNFDTDLVSSNIMLYAKWEKLPVADKYDVTFNSNGGSLVDNQLQLTAGSKVSKPLDPSKAGYTFDGWYQDSALTKQWNFDIDLVTDNITLYAKWNKISIEENKYNVSFESNGGSHVDSQVGIKEGNLVIKPFDPKREGFQFDGWYRDEDLKKIWNFDTDTVEENMTLYAKWVEVKPEIVKPDPNKPNPVLPSTGLDNNYIGVSMLLVSGSIILAMSKKKRKEIE